jgi:hypothetical protein
MQAASESAAFDAQEIHDVCAQMQIAEAHKYLTLLQQMDQTL